MIRNQVQSGYLYQPLLRLLFPYIQILLMLLAHHPSKTAKDALERYNKEPDIKLKDFARHALDEALVDDNTHTTRRTNLLY